MIGRRTSLSLVTAALLAVAAGCQTIGEDFDDLATALIPKTPGEAARMAANFNDADERREGLVLLSNAPFGGLEDYVSLYRDYAANDIDPLVRAEAIKALARHGAPEDALIIAANLGHEHPQVRWEAAKGLQRLHEPEVVPAVLAVLRDETTDPDIRMALASALGQYPEDRVFQGLIAALDSRELAVNVAALESLRTLTGDDHGLDPVAWLSWYRGVLERDEDPFAGRTQYVFPTYTRNRTMLERLAFWNPLTFEQPAPPAGLEPLGTRRTYAEEAAEGPRD